MRPTFTEMLAGIESVQSTVVMPRIMATGEMDVLWETGFTYRLLGFLKENGGRLLDLVLLENRDLRGLFRDVGPELEAAVESLQDRGLTARLRLWASTLPHGPHHKEDTGREAPFLERIYRDNARLKSALNDLILLLDEASRLAPDGSGSPGRERVHASLRRVIRENVARQSALSDELLRLWRG